MHMPMGTLMVHHMVMVTMVTVMVAIATTVDTVMITAIITKLMVTATALIVSHIKQVQICKVIQNHAIQSVVDGS
jgi:hypothetical protein